MTHHNGEQTTGDLPVVINDKKSHYTALLFGVFIGAFASATVLLGAAITMSAGP